MLPTKANILRMLASLTTPVQLCNSYWTLLLHKKETKAFIHGVIWTGGSFLSSHTLQRYQGAWQVSVQTLIAWCYTSDAGRHVLLSRWSSQNMFGTQEHEILMCCAGDTAT
jgi:hypothetical protein